MAIRAKPLEEVERPGRRMPSPAGDRNALLRHFEDGGDRLAVTADAGACARPVDEALHMTQRHGITPEERAR